MRADVFVVCDGFQATFPSWQNRNRIKGPQGAIWLTVPVARPHDLPINKIEISNDRLWARKHLRSIEMCYGKAPHFDEYVGRLREIYLAERRLLCDFTTALIEYFRECLGIEKEIIRSSDLGARGEKSALVIDLCKKTGCNAAYLAAGTRVYIDEEAFKREGIEIEFQDLQHPTYPQQYGGFVSHLSVLDILMNCGPESAEIIRSAGDRSRSPAKTVT
jgi:hypothetical protein